MINFLRKAIGSRLDKEVKFLAKNSSWVFFANIFRIGLNFIRAIIIARGLGADIFGTYSMIVAFVQMTQEFFNLNLGTVLIKFGATYKSEKRIDKLVALLKVIFIVNIGVVILSVLLLFSLILLAYDTFIKRPNLHLFVIFYAIAYGTTFFDYMSSSILRLYYKFKVNSIVTIVASLIEFIAIVFTVTISPKNIIHFFIAIVATRFVSSSLINGFAFWERRKEILPNIKAKFSLIKNQRREIASFTIHNSLSRTAYTIMRKGDIILLGALTEPRIVAFYTVARKFSEMVLILTDPIARSIYPQLADLYSTKRFKDIQILLSKLTQFALYPSLLFLVVTYFFKEKFIVLLLGQEYLPATLPFWILLINALLRCTFFWTLPAIQAFGLVGFRLKIYLISIVLGFSVSVFFIPIYGASGSAIGVTLANVLIISGFIYKVINTLQVDSRYKITKL